MAHLGELPVWGLLMNYPPRNDIDVIYWEVRNLYELMLQSLNLPVDTYPLSKEAAARVRFRREGGDDVADRH